MKKILVNLFHPNFSHSRGNRALFEAVHDVPGVTCRDLYAEYASSAGFQVDVAKEQALLEQHDVVVFQHPVMWYNVPPLLKAWQEQVLLRDWAYPPGKGDRLQGKTYLAAVTTGSPADAYRAGGTNGFSVGEFLRAEQAIAGLCGMHYLPVFITYGVIPVAWGGIGDLELAERADSYRSLLLGLSES